MNQAGDCRDGMDDKNNENVGVWENDGGLINSLKLDKKMWTIWVFLLWKFNIELYVGKQKSRTLIEISFVDDLVRKYILSYLSFNLYCTLYYHF